jgi:hypothetical protein
MSADEKENGHGDDPGHKGERKPKIKKDNGARGLERFPEYGKDPSFYRSSDPEADESDRPTKGNRDNAQSPYQKDE